MIRTIIRFRGKEMKVKKKYLILIIATAIFIAVIGCASEISQHFNLKSSNKYKCMAC